MSGELVFILAVIFVATLARAALGFGEALVAMPLLAIVLPIKVAAPLVALAGTFTAAIILCREWKHLELRVASVLIISGAVGVPGGVLTLNAVDDRVVKLILAALVLGFSVWSLCKPNPPELTSDRTAPIFGLTAGLLTGAYNTGGPPVVIFGALRRWTTNQFRATLQSWCLAGGGWALICHAWQHNITHDVVMPFVYSIPLILIACVVGRRLTSGVPTERFIRYVHAGLIVIGVYLVASSFILPSGPTANACTDRTTRTNETICQPPDFAWGQGS